MLPGRRRADIQLAGHQGGSLPFSVVPGKASCLSPALPTASAATSVLYVAKSNSRTGALFSFHNVTLQHIVVLHLFGVTV